MVTMIDLSDPSVVFSGRIFWDMLRPGARLAVLGPHGCMTSVIQKVVEMARGKFYVQTRNSRYVLATGELSLSELQAMPTLVGA